MDHNVVFSIFLIFTGAAVLSTLALVTRQSLLVAYMCLGLILGPYGLKFFNQPDNIQRIGDVGILFLLFLLGLHLPPQKLIHMLKKMTVVGLVSSFLFFVVGGVGAWLLSYSIADCLIIAAAMMFSSTIIGIKLLPTTILHHQHTGEVMISVLLLQDLLAIVVLLCMKAATLGGNLAIDIILVLVGFPIILFIAYLLERFLLAPLLSSFSKIKEYVFLLSIAWCLSLAELASYLGLSDEVGAFVAGVSLAASPISVYIAESLKPVRDFFLVLFFFAVGASFNVDYFFVLVIPALLFAIGYFLIKPCIYRWLLGYVGEGKDVSWEVGVRLGQVSEFSLIIAFSGLESGLLSMKAGYFIQAVTMISFLISSYVVVMRYPSPVAMTDRLRRD